MGPRVKGGKRRQGDGTGEEKEVKNVETKGKITRMEWEEEEEEVMEGRGGTK